MKLRYIMSFVTLLIASCSGRTQQGVLVDSNAKSSGTSTSTLGGQRSTGGGLQTGQSPDGSLPAGVSAAAGGGATCANGQITGVAGGGWSAQDNCIFINTNGWVGGKDDISVAWLAGAGSASPPAASAAPPPTKPTTPAPTAPAPAPTPSAGAGLTDQLVQAACSKAGCHDGTSQAPDLTRASGSDLKNYVNQQQGMIGRAGLDQNAVQAWMTGSAAGGQPAAAGASPGTLTLTEDANGNCTNPQVWSGKVGGTVTIQNNCKSGYTPHTNGSPFPHGDTEIPPGGSKQYPLQSPVQSGTGQTYRHTDGSDNSQSQPLNINVQ